MVEKDNGNVINLQSDVADGSAIVRENEAGNIGEDGKEKDFLAVDLAKDGAQEQKEAILGKFKSVDALTKAYGALEAAFTKKSQQLASMKEKVELLEKKAGFGVEKLRKNASLRRAREREFDVFLRELGGLTAEKDTDKESLEVDTLGKDEVEKSGVGEVAPVKEIFTEKAGRYELNDEQSGEKPADRLDEGLNFKEAERFEKPFVSDGTGEKLALDADGQSASQTGVGQEKNCVAGGKDTDWTKESLYQAVQQNEQVRLQIIGEYLSSIGRSGAPISVGGMGTLAIPPKRAKTVGEAGGMALRYFKNTQAER